MSKFNKGFTLIELMIVVMIIAIGLAVFIPGCSGSKEVAEQEAIQFASTILNMKEAKATCMNKDSDHNGYVSCTVFGKIDGKTQAIPIECATKYSLNEGCRATMTGLLLNQLNK